MFDRDGPPDSDAPPGFEPVEPASPHLRHIGPLWCRVAGDEVVFALRIRPEHLNNRGTAHGGILATVADVACGYTFRHVVPDAPALLTTQLTTTFLRPARGGDLVEAEARVVELGRTIASSVVTLAVGGRTIGHAAALFRVAPATGRPGPASLGDSA